MIICVKSFLRNDTVNTNRLIQSGRWHDSNGSFKHFFYINTEKPLQIIPYFK